MLPPDPMSTVTRLRGVHPGWALVALDLLGLAIAGYLAAVEPGGGVPYGGAVHGCDTVAQSEYSRIAGIPVAVYGVVLTLITLAMALAWIRTANRRLLGAVHGLSLVSRVLQAS